MFRSQEDIRAAVRSRLTARRMASALVKTSDPWPLRLSLGRMRQDDLASHMGEVSTYVRDLRAWAIANEVEVEWTTRLAGGAQIVPTHVIVRDLDVAARLCGTAEGKRLSRMRARLKRLGEAFPQATPDVCERVLAKTDAWDNVDFSLLVDASLWFASHDATGLTPRQVPLEGFHAKWLNATGRRDLVALLAGKGDLGLVRTPQLVEFAYLDPAYLADGGRRYDSWVIGDAATLPYDPALVVIVENRDSFLYFPELDGALCVNGAGKGGVAHVRMLPWVRNVPHVLYWGDMDADGLVILDAYRRHGLAVESVLMDLESYRRYAHLGTSMATGKLGLDERAYATPKTLNGGERALYELLCDPRCTTARRIEQERIPLEDARAAVLRAVGAPTAEAKREGDDNDERA